MASTDPTESTQMDTPLGTRCETPSCNVLDYHPFRCNSCKGKFCRQHRTEAAHSCLHPGTSAARTSQLAKTNSADLDAIGAHCEVNSCNRLDFLPFTCPSCKGKFCSDHQREASHNCARAGAWAANRQSQQTTSNTGTIPQKATILTHDQQCAHLKCKTLINTPLVPAIDCESCGRSYCLKHRLPEEHACATIPKPQKGKDRGMAEALGKLRAWGAGKKDSQHTQNRDKKNQVSEKLPSQRKESTALTRIVSPFTLARTKKSNSAFIMATNNLKASAKGDDKVPRDKRIYVHLEAVAEGEGHAGAKIPRADAFYSSEWSVGKVLDAAARTLTVTNVNNRGGGEEQKLRVFSVESGRLLEFNEKLGTASKTGDTLVLLRGVGRTDAI